MSNNFGKKLETTAEPIHQDVVDTYAQIRFHEPSQNFLAEHSNVVVSVWISEYNRQVNDDSFFFNVYDTQGSRVTGGTITGMTDDYLDWVELDISDTDLTIGETYTVVLTNDTARWGFGYATSDKYSGGELFSSQNTDLVPANRSYDLTFRVTPVPQALPSSAEPTDAVFEDWI